MELVLINSNRMSPPIAPVGLEYVAGAARRARLAVDVVDLCLAEDPQAELRSFFSRRSPRLVGISFRNADDCFWPSAAWFVDGLRDTVRAVRALTDAPVVLGGVGFSIFAREIVERTGADFGIHGDGEEALVSLCRELEGDRRFDRVEGLLWRGEGRLLRNPPAWADRISLARARGSIDNRTYFEKGGQAGVETKRGCNRSCLYCADPLAKGRRIRSRDPREVADEVEGLLREGIDVLHLCDSEFNVPGEHARAVCEELQRRSLGERVRWYAYLAVNPFDADLADRMRRAGCAGIDFTGDSADPGMLSTYREPHRKEDIARAVRLCREAGIAVMIDLLLGGPGETPESVAETIGFLKLIRPDCAGAALGLRVYPGTPLAEVLAAEGPLETNPGIKRRYEGPVDFFRPTFYISAALGERPAELVRELIGGDRRFFEPALEAAGRAGEDPTSNYNYNDNSPLAAAIAAGERGAYWDILRKLRGA